MKTMLLGLAATAAVIVPAVPARAERWSDANFVAAANVSVHRGGSDSRNNSFGRQWTDGRDREGRRHDGRRDRDRFDDGIFVGGWGYYYEDNPAWQSEGFNDWWHDRSSRSQPRWVQNNQNCERQYSTGAGWKC